jgi:hypothetical protein
MYDRGSEVHSEGERVREASTLSSNSSSAETEVLVVGASLAGDKVRSARPRCVQAELSCCLIREVLWSVEDLLLGYSTL